MSHDEREQMMIDEKYQMTIDEGTADYQHWIVKGIDDNKDQITSGNR